MGKCLILCKGQSALTKENREVDKILSSANKRLWRKSYKKEYLSFFQTTKSTQTTESAFVERIELFNKSKFEFELLKVVDCF